MKELNEVSLYLKENTFIKIGSTLDLEQDKVFVNLFNVWKQNFTFKPSEMSGISLRWFLINYTFSLFSPLFDKRKQILKENDKKPSLMRYIRY